MKFCARLNNERNGEIKMVTKSIIFNTKMIKTILDHQKTQVRRIAKDWKPPYEPGDILWVQEVWRPIEASSSGWCRIEYQAGGTKDFQKIIAVPKYQEPWHSAIYMPKDCARIFLRVRNIQMEKLQDITNNDAIAEGFTGVPCSHLNIDDIFGCTDCMNSGWIEPPVVEFADFWNKYIKRDDLQKYSWDYNPRVWKIEFEECQEPIGWDK